MITKLSERHAPLAQLDRASGYGPEGRGFESLTACQKDPKPYGSCSQVHNVTYGAGRTVRGRK